MGILCDFPVYAGDGICFFFQAEDGIRDYKVTEFRRVLFRSRRYLKNEPIAARPDAFTYRTGKFVRRHRAAVFLATLAIVRSEERRVGEEGRSRGSPDHLKKKKSLRMIKKKLINTRHSPTDTH